MFAIELLASFDFLLPFWLSAGEAGGSRFTPANNENLRTVMGNGRLCAGSGIESNE
jgi:hypothetical protein